MTFIAVAIAKLVDDGKVTWQDSIKQHLPWFELVDKYAETHATLGDLASMNFVVEDGIDSMIKMNFDPEFTERKMVESLRLLNTTRPFRIGYNPSSYNFAILGQVIEAVTNTTWATYLKTSIWEPLGMHNTAAHPTHVASSQLSSGHLMCNSKVIGPFNQLNDTMIALRPDDKPIASSSIVSSTADLATFSSFLLASDHLGLFQHPALVNDLFTGT
ncbi:Aste57867_5312 [Aphanomyces stellatus]|uniref:Aste57867_5312 protein n=1 Tax=Aphanomyces stellatus TaxID=120398 RepID=A0A485KGX5_9STRA|nr:hypothetical protein As57867_005299 [Aphanomyces stellatus]VFT82378.1 Aste57867_5312 [Aphanomyces stellatus]